MLFIVSCFTFNIRYAFPALSLVILVFYLILCQFSRIVFLKYLVVLIYVRGVIVSISHISCLCWNKSRRFSLWFLVLRLFPLKLWDLGMYFKIGDFGELLRLFIFIRILFNFTVSTYSLLLYKGAGSLRF